jgi:hypothetical protein
MLEIEKEASTFGARKFAELSNARQVAAMQLACGIDLSRALQAGPEELAGLIRSVERIIERERLKGMRRHWSYDLNRHIALKQVLDRLRALAGRPAPVNSPRPRRERVRKNERRPQAPSIVDSR